MDSQLTLIRRKRDYCGLILILIICLGCSVSCTTERAIRLRNKSIEEWQSHQFQELKRSHVSSKDEWLISSRKLKTGNFIEFKIEGEINTTPELCKNAFIKDIFKQSTKLKNRKYPVYNITKNSKDSLMTYVIHNEAFPFKNTEMSILYTFEKNESKNQIISWREAWDISKIPTNKNLSRVETFRGSWNFIGLPDGSTFAVNTVQFDPKRMPAWLYRPMVISFLKNGLKDIRKSVMEKASIIP